MLHSLLGEAQRYVSDYGYTAVFLGVFLEVFLPRAAQILKQALLDLAASEIRRGCHVYLLRPGRGAKPRSQCAAAVTQARCRLY